MIKRERIKSRKKKGNLKKKGITKTAHFLHYNEDSLVCYQRARKNLAKAEKKKKIHRFFISGLNSHSDSGVRLYSASATYAAVT